MFEGGCCSLAALADRYDIDAVVVVARPILDVVDRFSFGAVRRQQRASDRRDLPVLPSHKQQYVPVGSAMRFQRSLQTFPVVKAHA